MWKHFHIFNSEASKMSDRKATTDENVNVHGLEHASVVKFTGDRIAGFAESERQNVKSAADEIGSQIEARLMGKPPQGENDTVIAATILINALNRRGTSWGAVTTAAEPADCEASDSNGRKLQIQVVRASGHGEVWRQLGAVGEAEVISEVAVLVRELKAAIRKKALRYPPAVQSGLVLALDANKLPAFVLSSVREAAVEHLRALCMSTAFSSVWVVGPTAELTYALFEKA
jgi:hypothetical protein